MNKNEQFIITINRELGSGGRSIGEKLAKTLNVPFFDKALVKALRDKYNLTIEEIEKLKGKKVSWWNDIVRGIQPFYNAAKEQYHRFLKRLGKKSRASSPEEADSSSSATIPTTSASSSRHPWNIASTA